MKTKKIIFLFAFVCLACQLKAQSAIVTNLTFSNPTCNNSDGSVSVAPTGGVAPYTYEWKQGVSAISFNTTASVSGLTPEFYTIKVTDANNDFKIDTITLSNGIKAYITSNSASCQVANGTANVTIVQGGLAPFTFLWSTGATTQTVTNIVGNTTLQVEAQDANGCKAYFYNSITTDYSSTIGSEKVNVLFTLTSNNTKTPEDCPLNNGTITINPTSGIAPYTYLWNTTPVQVTPTATALKSGYYNVIFTDANGCKGSVWEFVDLNATGLSITNSITQDVCDASIGAVTINITGGYAPYAVLWEDGSTTLSRTGLSYGNYSVKITDNINCVIKSNVFIDNFSPVQISFTSTPTDCDNISGSVLANPFGGVAPYTYKWDGGATTPLISNIGYGYKSIEVTDVNGCKSSAWTLIGINGNCGANISGNIFQDNNGNCVQDMGEYPIVNETVHSRALLPNNDLADWYALSGNDGNYSIRYVLPDTYTLNKIADDIRTPSCLVGEVHTITIPTGGVSYPNKDFAMNPSSLYEDVKLLYPSISSPPRPGFDYTYSVFYKNNGTVFSDGFIEVIYSSLETFVSSVPAADYYNPATRTLRFNYSTLLLGEVRSVKISCHLPATVVLGSTFTHAITADIGAVDPSPLNNFDNHPFTVIGSYDPNDLRVTPRAEISQAEVDLTYSIRFQNTGTYPAELVIVRDTLEENLDISTITDISASHKFKFQQLEKRVLQFAFENINLADSARNEKASHGFVTFKIKRKANLALGTEIKNKAEIYFDFNEPIVTNTTTNIISFLIDGTIDKKASSAGNVFPNPAKEYTDFVFEKDIVSIQFMNSGGLVVLNQKVNEQKEIRLTFNISRGMYFYKAIGKDGNFYSGKLIVE